MAVCYHEPITPAAASKSSEIPLHAYPEIFISFLNIEMLPVAPQFGCCFQHVLPSRALLVIFILARIGFIYSHSAAFSNAEPPLRYNREKF
jgi:hypothetical protein